MAGNTIIASSERLHVAVPEHKESIYVRVGSPLLTNGVEISINDALAVLQALGVAAREAGIAIVTLKALMDEEVADA